MSSKQELRTEIDMRPGGRGLELLQKAQIYERKPAQSDDWVEELAVSMRPKFVRALEGLLDGTRVITEQEIFIAAVRRQTVGTTTYYNHDVIAMAVNSDAPDVPTPDIRILRYWDFQAQYQPATLPELD